MVVFSGCKNIGCTVPTLNRVSPARRSAPAPQSLWADKASWWSRSGGRIEERITIRTGTAAALGSTLSSQLEGCGGV